MRGSAGRALGAVVVAVMAVAGASPALGGGAVFTVTNTNDSGAGSLRQAILDANATPGADIIEFAIPGSGVQTIVTASPLAVTESVAIDGHSQSGAAPNTDPVADNAAILIELAGTGATDGLTITGGSTTVQGLSLHGFQTAIALSTAADNLIQGNFIGLTASGALTDGNLTGVTITGTTGLDRIGDSTPAARNVISGNSSAGVLLTSVGDKKILGNLIGTAPNGVDPAANGIGVEFSTTNGSQIGGPNPEDGNVISGNTSDGISMTQSTFDLVQHNRIGTDAAGTSKLGNGGRGVRVEALAALVQFLDNVVSGNAGDGLSFDYGNIYPAGIFVSANFIGTDASGTLPLGNGGAGVLSESAPVLQVNGNTIAYNKKGIWATEPSFLATQTFSANSIHSNHGLGIVLGADGTIRPNVPVDFLNFPLITSVVSNGSTTTIQGTYYGPGPQTVHLEFFSSPACSKEWPRQFDEGASYLGEGSVTTDFSGHGTFSVDLPVALTDEVVTATARTLVYTLRDGISPDPPGPQTAHTSGFSQRLPFSVSPMSGDPAGAVPVSISGTSFVFGATATFGNQPGSGLVVWDSTHIQVDTPALAPGAAYDVTVTNTDGTHGTLPLGFVADFLDVPPSHLFHDDVVTLASDGITGGVGGGNYGVAQSVLRQQMAVFLLKGKHGICYTPAPCTGVFSDVTCPSTFADWIEALASEGITGGCGAGVYCPQNPVRRDQMAVFLLKAEHGSSYLPPACAGTFPDVPCPSTFADWIEQLAAENITGGCGAGNYCPGNPNTRGQMAVFIVKTFSLQ